MSNLPAAKAASTMTPAERRDAILAKAKQRKEAGEAPSHRPSGGLFANIDGNNGAFTVGRENTPVEADTQFVVPIDMCLHGWRYWEGGKPGKELMVPVLDAGRPTPPEDEPKAGSLPKPRERDGWSETVSIKLSAITGELKDMVLTLDCSNQSSLGQADDLLATIIDQTETEDGQRGLFNPIVVVEVDHYHNKAYSRDVYFPTFKILGWTDGEETVMLETDDAGEVDLLA